MEWRERERRRDGGREKERVGDIQRKNKEITQETKKDCNNRLRFKPRLDGVEFHTGINA